MTPLSPPATIAFIGLGMMGRPMASRLAGAGFKLRVFDVSQKAVSDFVGAHPSALATASAKAAAEDADALITMLPDGKIVRQAVLEGRDAAVEGLAPGAVVLDMSSSNPVDTQKLARDLAARGLALLDAPVSGGVKRAVDGSLSIMVGGASADLERVRPVFGAMGKTITLCGPAGAGHALKALNNYLSAAGLVAMCEALVVGEAFGLDPGTMVDVFNSSTGKSNATEVKGRQFVVSRSFAAGFTTALMAKDLRTAGEVASHLKLNMPNLEQAVAYWTDADGKLGKGADHTEIFRYAERLAEEVLTLEAQAKEKAWYNTKLLPFWNRDLHQLWVASVASLHTAAGRTKYAKELEARLKPIKDTDRITVSKRLKEEWGGSHSGGVDGHLSRDVVGVVQTMTSFVYRSAG